MVNVVTFGETMGQFNPKDIGPFRPEGDNLLDYAGAESNFAVGLQKLGIIDLKSKWISRLGDDVIGNFIHTQLHGRVNVIADKYPGEFTGRSYVTHYDDREPEKIYERKGSAASKLTFSEIKPHLQDADLLHVTGITPALSDICYVTIFEALIYARRHGIPVSLDVNYREPLWTPEEARPVLEDMLGYSSIFKTGYSEAETVWGRGTNLEEYARFFYDINKRLVIITDGGNGAITFDGVNLIEHPGYKVEVVDPIGAGDAFMAGFVGVLLSRYTLEQFFDLGKSLRRKILEDCLETANVCGALTCTKTGDTAAMPNLQQVEDFLEKN